MRSWTRLARWSFWLWLGVAAAGAASAHADFLDDDSAHAAELAARRHRVETRLVESWLRALGLTETQIAVRLAAMTDEDLHRIIVAPQTLWVVGAARSGGRR